jgi:hypothetical protein
MDGPDLWDDLRERGVDADDPDVRAAVRAALECLERVHERSGAPAARRCVHAMRAALDYQARHPDTGDMSSFEVDFQDEDEG